MQWTEVKIICDTVADETVLDRIADLFYDLGLHGVVIDDPHLQPDENWGPDAVMPPSQYAVSGYFPQNGEHDSNIDHLQEKLKTIKELHRLPTQLAFKNIDEKDWAESWKTFFKPIKVSHNIYVKPTWEDLASDPEDIVVEIDPGMAFGTGTHPTTVMCIQMLQKHLKPGHSLLDVGTGSGILLVAAAKLGAKTMLGIDSDRLATKIAVANLARNGIAPNCVGVIQGHLVEGIGHRFDLVIANLLTEIIVELLDHVQCVIQPAGIFICSGIYAGHQDRVLESMQARQMHLLETRELENWVCLAARP